MAAVPPERAPDFTRSPAVAERLPGFFRTLRENGFAPGVAELVDAARLLGALPAGDPAGLRDAWKALVSNEADQWRRFDGIFDAYWLGKGQSRPGVVAAGRRPAIDAPGRDRPWGAVGRPGLPDLLGRAQDAAGTTDGERGRGASSTASLTAVDLRHIVDPEELRRAHALAADLARRMKHRLSRRQRAARRGRRIDLRRVIHRSIQHGGLPFDLVYRRPRAKTWKLVVLLDVSGSMNLYSAVFMRFVHGIIEHFRQSEAFVFHTRLVHIASVLRESDPEVAMERLAVMAGGWSGGTRIGDCLATFNRNYAARMLDSRSIVIILSDGFDTGAPEHLSRELAAIKRRARRLIWLNPLAGWRGYEPAASGMAAALPHIDLFAPAHSLESLMALEPVLERL